MPRLSRALGWWWLTFTGWSDGLAQVLQSTCVCARSLACFNSPGAGNSVGRLQTRYYQIFSCARSVGLCPCCLAGWVYVRFTCLSMLPLAGCMDALMLLNQLLNHIDPVGKYRAAGPCIHRHAIYSNDIVVHARPTCWRTQQSFDLLALFVCQN